MDHKRCGETFKGAGGAHDLDSASCTGVCVWQTSSVHTFGTVWCISHLNKIAKKKLLSTLPAALFFYLSVPGMSIIYPQMTQPRVSSPTNQRAISPDYDGMAPPPPLEFATCPKWARLLGSHPSSQLPASLCGAKLSTSNCKFVVDNCRNRVLCAMQRALKTAAATL